MKIYKLLVTFGALVIGTANAYEPRPLHGEEFLNRMSVSVAGTYTKSTNNGLSVGDVFVQENDSGLIYNDSSFDGDRKFVFLDPDFSWDYSLGLTYHCHNSNNRVFFTYDHFRDHDTNDTVNIRNLGIQPVLDGDDFIDEITLGHSRVEHQSQEYILGIGHHIHLHPAVGLNVMGFFEYDRLTRRLNESNDGYHVWEEEDGIALRHTSNEVEGFGPGFGAKIHFRPFSRYHGIGFFAGFKTSLLYAENEFYQDYLFDPTESDEDVDYSYNADDSHSLINKLDIHFGFDISSCLLTAYGRLPFDIAIGMRYVNWFNVFKNGNAAYNVPQLNAGNDGADGSNNNYQSPSSTNETLSVVNGFAANTGYPNDWGRIGPYIQFKLGGRNA